jgi:hypothetical protein
VILFPGPHQFVQVTGCQPGGVFSRVTLQTFPTDLLVCTYNQPRTRPSACSGLDLLGIR